MRGRQYRAFRQMGMNGVGQTASVRGGWGGCPVRDQVRAGRSTGVGPLHVVPRPVGRPRGRAAGVPRIRRRDQRGVGRPIRARAPADIGGAVILLRPDQPQRLAGGPIPPGVRGRGDIPGGQQMEAVRPDRLNQYGAGRRVLRQAIGRHAAGVALAPGGIQVGTQPGGIGGGQGIKRMPPCFGHQSQPGQRPAVGQPMGRVGPRPAPAAAHPGSDERVPPDGQPACVGPMLHAATAQIDQAGGSKSPDHPKPAPGPMSSRCGRAPPLPLRQRTGLRSAS
ncbi:MAG: hypothetical protein MI924_38785 [Chloroflexales bacterium]|nr:hypothetical protein [Chloroflexales bacterium]